MGCEIQLLESEKERTKNAIAGVLRQVAHKIKHGNLTMKQGPESLFIHFFDGMTLEIKIKENHKRITKMSFNLELFVAHHGQDSIAIG